MAVAPSAETVNRHLVLNQMAFLYEGKLYGKLGTRVSQRLSFVWDVGSLVVQCVNVGENRAEIAGKACLGAKFLC